MDDAQVVTYHLRMIDANVEDMSLQNHPVLILATSGPMWYAKDMQGLRYQFEVAEPGKQIIFSSADGWTVNLKINRANAFKPPVQVEEPGGFLGGLSKVIGGDFQKSFENSYKRSYKASAERNVKPYFTDLSFNLSMIKI